MKTVDEMPNYPEFWAFESYKNIFYSNNLQPHHANTTGLDADQLHPDTLAFWERLQPILRAADQDGRIDWAIQESGQPNFDFNERLRQTRDAAMF